MSTIQAKVNKAMQLRHPEHDVVVAAAIVSYWFENGRWVGFKLSFAGESAVRHLTFNEIRELQRVDASQGR